MTCTLSRWSVELHSGTIFNRGFKQFATATSPAAVGSKKPKNDEVRRLGNNPLPSPKRDAVLWRSRYCSSIKFDVFSCLQFG